MRLGEDFGLLAGLDFGDGGFGGFDFGGVGVDFQGHTEDLLAAGGQFDDAALYVRLNLG